MTKSMTVSFMVVAVNNLRIDSFTPCYCNLESLGLQYTRKLENEK